MHSNYCHNCGRPLSKQKPLSLEQLRGMDGEAVYIINQSQHPQNCRSCWEVVSSISEDILYPKGADYCYRIDDYGKTWIAY